MKSWKTTTLGILAIVVALTTAATEFIQTGAANIPTLVTGILTGWGLIQAKDATVTGLPK